MQSFAARCLTCSGRPRKRPVRSGLGDRDVVALAIGVEEAATPGAVDEDPDLDVATEWQVPGDVDMVDLSTLVPYISLSLSLTLSPLLAFQCRRSDQGRDSIFLI